jgi:hypothetical protein
MSSDMRSACCGDSLLDVMSQHNSLDTDVSGRDIQSLAPLYHLPVGSRAPPTMKKLFALGILIAAGWMAAKRYQADAARKLAAADLREKMTIGDLREALGSPRGFLGHYSFAHGSVRAYFADDTSAAAVPFIITATADFPGTIRGSSVQAYKDYIASAKKQRREWVELGTDPNGKTWLLNWEEGDNGDIVSISLMRAVPNIGLAQFRCPKGYAEVYGVMGYRPDVPENWTFIE